MVITWDGGLTEMEQKFCFKYFETRSPRLSAIDAGYSERSAKAQAMSLLRRPDVKDFLRELWEAADSPIVMGVRERKEKLSLIARGMIGTTFTEEGEIDWDAVRNMPSVKEVTVEEIVIAGETKRTIKVKLLNPVEAIHELTWMEKMLRINEGTTNINPTINYFVTEQKVIDALQRIGDRTKIELTGDKENGSEENTQG